MRHPERPWPVFMHEFRVLEAGTRTGPTLQGKIFGKSRRCEAGVNPGEKMVKGIGTDISHIERIKNLAPEALSRILTPPEEDYCRRYPAYHERVAGRFSAKEAILKALGTGWAQGIGWRQIEILPDTSGAPIAALSGKALERMLDLGATHCLVSISHQGDYAVAFAILE